MRDFPEASGSHFDAATALAPCLTTTCCRLASGASISLVQKTAAPRLRCALGRKAHSNERLIAEAQLHGAFERQPGGLPRRPNSALGACDRMALATECRNARASMSDKECPAMMRISLARNALFAADL